MAAFAAVKLVWRSGRRAEINDSSISDASLARSTRHDRLSRAAMRNLEAKFRLPDLALARRRAEAIGFELRTVLIQRDTFFRVEHGKLKLREEPGGAALIYYRRDQLAGLDLSAYQIVPVAHPEPLRAMLVEALGVLAEVRKERILMMRGTIRLHLDRVEGLGEFGEIEAVLDANDRAESSRPAVDEILAALDVSELIGVSYFELLRGQ